MVDERKTSQKLLQIAARASDALQAGRFADACSLLPQVIAHDPGNSEHFTNYSAALFAVGKYQRAEAAALQATRLDPNSPEAWSNLGIALQAQGVLKDAAAAYQQAIHLEPRHIDARVNLALACEAVGDIRSAGQLLIGVVQDAPLDTTALYELGRILVNGRHPKEALPYLSKAAQLDPQQALIANTHGVALRQLGQSDEAIREYRRAIAIDPEFSAAYINLARACNEMGLLDEAIQAGRRSVRLEPQSIEAINNLASALRSLGNVDEAAELFLKASSLTTDTTPVSNYLCAEQYRTAATAERLHQIHGHYGLKFGQATSAHQQRRDISKSSHHAIDRPLRVGFVSPDLGTHPVGFFLAGLLENLDRQRVEPICYSDRRVRDSLTARIERAAAEWRETAGVSDQQLARQVSNDQVDILIDLAGHTNGNRLKLFADRAASIQASWMGYVGTTGLPAMDFLIADRYHVRDGEEQNYTEKVARLPNGYVCYSPPRSPEVSQLPAIKNGHVTFGAFHNPAKVSEPTMIRWASILGAVRNSRLLFKYWGYDSRAVKERIRTRFAMQGISPDRLSFVGATPLAAHLRAFAEIDLMLDPLPYSGGLTTCESLWMGVPVITMPGSTFAGRHATSHLYNAGLQQLVADNDEHYVSLVSEWANDIERLAELRSELRNAIAESPLFDCKRFASDFAALLHDMWQTQGQKPRSSVAGPHTHRNEAGRSAAEL